MLATSSTLRYAYLGRAYPIDKEKNPSKKWPFVPMKGGTLEARERVQTRIGGRRVLVQVRHWTARHGARALNLGR